MNGMHNVEKILPILGHLLPVSVPVKKNRILTIIQIETIDEKAANIVRNGNKFQCGEWTIEAELNSKQNASLYIHNTVNKATFSYGKKKVDNNGKTYQCKKNDASTLFRPNKWQMDNSGNE